MRGLVVLAMVVTAAIGVVSPIAGQGVRTIVDEWATVQPPPAPVLRPVTVDPRTTALLVLDMQTSGCNPERRPRCIASLPRVTVLIGRASAAGVPLIYTLAGTATVADVLPQVRPLGDETLITRTVADKFLGTNLEQVLRDRGIRTVILVGTAAHGAVLYTGSGAALRGLTVIIPVDGMSSETAYMEQYVAFQMVNGPGVAARTTLTRTDLIRF